jgi:hypothetical protein
MRVPSERGANASTPRSLPVSCPVDGRGRTGRSAQERHTYHPSASREITTVLGGPSTGRAKGRAKGRDHRTARRPIFDRTSTPLSSVAPLPTSLSVKERQRVRA